MLNWLKICYSFCDRAFVGGSVLWNNTDNDYMIINDIMLPKAFSQEFNSLSKNSVTKIKYFVPDQY